VGLLSSLRVPISWTEVAKRTASQVIQDNVLGLAAELAYFFFLALVPALLFLVALASFFPIQQLTDQIVGALSRFAPADVLAVIRDQLQQISQNNNGGLLTLGLIGTIWSASSGMSSTMSTLNQAYHVTERRSWWRVRLTAILLTAALAAFVLISFALVLVGPSAAEKIASTVGLSSVFTWSWKILQWPVIVALIMTGLAFVYYIGPDVQQDWIWIMPGAVVGTLLWLTASLGFKWYVSAFADYQKTYGVIGGAMVTLLWFYVSGLAMLIGAELNAVMEHASPLGKDPGERVAGQHPAAQPTASVAVGGGSSRGLALPAYVRPAELMMGGAALAIEMAAIVFRHLRRVKR
jgi:membrane protein